MKTWLSLLVGVILVFGAFYLLSALVGLLFWLGVGGIILLCVFGLIRSMIVERVSNRPLSSRREKRLDRTAERALRDLERKSRD